LAFLKLDKIRQIACLKSLFSDQPYLIKSGPELARPHFPIIALELGALWRRYGLRLSSGLLVGAAICLFSMERLNPELAERLQISATMLFAPTLSALSQPLATWRATEQSAQHLFDVFEENTRLRAENQTVTAWRDQALKLTSENNALRAELHVQPDPQLARVVARAIGDPNGGFVESVIVAAGTENGVAKGQPVIVSSGTTGDPAIGAMIGKVVLAGEKIARVLLITDVNSRIPVTLEQSHAHAILAGDNSGRPLLLFLPTGTTLSNGERVLTSASDGVLPAGLVVGVVTEQSDGPRVEPAADLNRLDFVQVLQRAVVPSLPAQEQPVAKGRRRP
jgi:rod shape-determining protein MreC